MARTPMTSTVQESPSLSISHSRPPSTLVPKTVSASEVNYSRSVTPSTTSSSPNDRQRSVGIQAKIGGPLKILTPRPWKGSTTPAPPSLPTSTTPAPAISETTICPSSEVSAASTPRPASVHSIIYDSTPQATPTATPVATPLATPKRTPRPTWGEDHAYYSSGPEVNDEALLLDERVIDGIKSKTKKSSNYDIKLTMQRKVQNNGELQIQEMLVHDGSGNMEAYTPQEAMKALNVKNSVKAKYSRKRKIAEASFIAALHGEGQVPHSQDQFVNEMHPLDQQASASTASAKSQIHIKEEPISDVDKDDDENEDDDVDEEIIYELTS